MATLVVSIVTFVAGLVIGHWLALGRDRRKEFNEAAQPIRAFLLGEERALYHPERRPSVAQWDAFESCLSRRHRVRFTDARKEYEDSDPGQSGVGPIPYPHPELVHDCVRRLLRFTERR